MPENEFEKKVSSEMQELKFKPSEQVWLRVEERIRKKNKRRVFIIIFLLAGLALLSYWQRSNLFGEKKNGIVKNEAPVTKNAEEKQRATDEKTKPGLQEQSTEQSKESKEPIVADTKKEDEVIDKNISKVNSTPTQKAQPTTKKIPKKTGNASMALVKSKPAIQQKISNIAEMEAMKADAATKVSPKNDTLGSTGNKNINEVKLVQIVQAEVKQVENKIDSAKSEAVVSREQNIVEIKDTASKKEPLNDSAAAVVQQKSSVKKWKWGIEFNPGISPLKDGFFSFNMNKSADVSYQGSTSSGSGSGAVVSRQRPSEIKPGFAFQLGGFVQREISKRTSLLLGLQYGFYSNRLSVGRRRDSLLNYSNQFTSLQDANAVYNAGGDTIHYTNRYHFIELPFRLHWQLNKSRTSPVMWSNGFSASRLIATNAIMYDTSFNGIYYQNKKLLSKTQVSFSTSLSFTIANSRRMRWGIGPFADLHLNSLVNSPFEKKRYLFFAGIRTSILFNGK